LVIGIFAGFFRGVGILGGCVRGSHLVVGGDHLAVEAVFWAAVVNPPPVKDVPAKKRGRLVSRGSLGED
jgi:hypothetical protein